MIVLWDKLKKWLWAIVLAIVSLIALSKPRWVKEKEKEVKQRDKDIAVAVEHSDDLSNDYKEVKAKHDEEIKQAGESKPQNSFTNADDAASFIDDILNRR